MLPFLLKDCKGSNHFYFLKTILKIFFYRDDNAVLVVFLYKKMLLFSHFFFNSFYVNPLLLPLVALKKFSLV